MFVWKKEYETNIETIDDQHKKLFEISNEAYELLKNDLIVDKYNKIIDIIIQLRDYTRFHFKTEEQYMLDNNYKKSISHKLQHDIFIAELDKINLQSVDENQEEYILDLLNFLYRWIDNHILKNDKLINEVK